MWQLPDSELGVLGDVAGLDVLELGCGAAQFGLVLARLGARVVGLDASERQLDHARREHSGLGLELELVHGSAEALPFADAPLRPRRRGPRREPLRGPVPLGARVRARPAAGRPAGVQRRNAFEAICVESGDGHLGAEARPGLLRAAPDRVAGRVGRSSSSATATGSGSSGGAGSRSRRSSRCSRRRALRRRTGARRRPSGRGAGRWSRSGRCGGGGVSLSEHAAAEPRDVERATPPSAVEPAERNWAAGRVHLGRLGRARGRARSASGGGGEGRRRARLRHGVHLRVARAAGRAAGRRRSHARAARDGAGAAGASTGSSSRCVEASAEDVPLPAASFDLAVSEYGASIWADPYRWIPEAARLLRPGRRARLPRERDALGALLARRGGAADRRARRPYFGMHRFEWPDDGSVEFHLGYGEWIRLLRENGFEVLDLVEIQAPEGAEPSRFPGLPLPDWARRWPSEEIWRARKRRVSVSPAPPLLLASTSPQRRAILEQLRIPFEVVAPRYEEPAGRRSGRARAREGAVGRGRGRRATGARRRHGRAARRAVVREAGERGRGGGDAGGARRARRTRSCRGSALVTPGWEETGEETTRVSFPSADAAGSGRVRGDRRVGGAGRRLCDPGRGRRPRRAHRGRLPERRRPPGRPPSAPARRSASPAVRVRLGGSSQAPVPGTAERPFRTARASPTALSTKSPKAARARTGSGPKRPRKRGTSRNGGAALRPSAAR